MARLRSDFWVSAHLRRLDIEGIAAVQRRRGSPEAGAIFVKVDRLDGSGRSLRPGAAIPRRYRIRRRPPLRGPASEASPADVEVRLGKELRFDDDLWIVEIDDRAGRHRLDLAE